MCIRDSFSLALLSYFTPLTFNICSVPFPTLSHLYSLPVSFPAHSLSFPCIRLTLPFPHTLSSLLPSPSPPLSLSLAFSFLPSIPPLHPHVSSLLHLFLSHFLPFPAPSYLSLSLSLISQKFCLLRFCQRDIVTLCSETGCADLVDKRDVT